MLANAGLTLAFLICRQICATQKPNPLNPVDTLSAMFSVDSRIIVVSQESNGIIRVGEPGVQTDILDVRIDHLSFDGISDPDNALDIVLAAPEVQSFITAHGIGQPFNIFSPLSISCQE